MILRKQCNAFLLAVVSRKISKGSSYSMKMGVVSTQNSGQATPVTIEFDFL